MDFQISERSDFGVLRFCLCLCMSAIHELEKFTFFSFLAKAAYRNSQEAREMAVQLVVAGTTFDIPGENLS